MLTGAALGVLFAMLTDAHRINMLVDVEPMIMEFVPVAGA
jgi:hypothetical protein